MKYSHSKSLSIYFYINIGVEVPAPMAAKSVVVTDSDGLLITRYLTAILRISAVSQTLIINPATKKKSMLRPSLLSVLSAFQAPRKH